MWFTILYLTDFKSPRLFSVIFVIFLLLADLGREFNKGIACKSFFLSLSLSSFLTHTHTDKDKESKNLVLASMCFIIAIFSTAQIGEYIFRFGFNTYNCAQALSKQIQDFRHWRAWLCACVYWRIVVQGHHSFNLNDNCSVQAIILHRYAYLDYMQRRLYIQLYVRSIGNK